MTFLLAIFASKWGRYAVGAIAVVVLLLAVRAHFIHVGQQMGREEASADATKTVADEIKRVRSETDKQVEAAERRATEAQAAFAAAVDREATLARAITALSGKRAAGQEQVGKIPDPELHAYNIRQLAVRLADDKSQEYTLGEERKIAQLVTDYPLLKEQSQKQDASLAELRVQVQSLQNNVAALQTRQQAVDAYTVKLEGAYTQAYNAIPRKRNIILTLLTFGAKGKPAKLSLPEPAALFKHIN